MSNTLVQRVSEVKRRRVEIIPHIKLDIVDSVKDVVKPSVSIVIEQNSDEMEVDEITEMKLQNKFECPCGYLHGPGQGHHDDIHAVGLSNEPLLRGPD